MPDNEKIRKIRQAIRAWMEEPVSDADESYGKKLQEDIKRLWPEVFADIPARPVTNRDVLTIANLYLGEAAHFVEQYRNDEAFIEKHADFAKVKPRQIKKLYEDTIKAEHNTRAFQASMITLAGNEELSFSDTERHLRNAARGMPILELDDEIVTGRRPISEFMDTENQRERDVLRDAIDNAGINYDHMELRRIIRGRGRSYGEGGEEAA